MIPIPMEQTNIFITEYRENQDIDFLGVTSFKVQNTGESVVDINTIPVYPGKTLKLVEEDSTFCNFNFKAVFTEAQKLPKFKAIYKQLIANQGQGNNIPVPSYKVTLYSYDKADIVEFSQNISGHVTLTRSFDGGLTFPSEFDIDLGFVAANQVVKYDRGGSMDTNAIQFRNDDLESDSEVFMVGVVAQPWEISVELTAGESFVTYFVTNESGAYEVNVFDKNLINISETIQAIAGQEKNWHCNFDNPPGYVSAQSYFSIKKLSTGEIKYYMFQGDVWITAQEIPNPN